MKKSVFCMILAMLLMSISMVAMALPSYHAEWLPVISDAGDVVNGTVPVTLWDGTHSSALYQEGGLVSFAQVNSGLDCISARYYGGWTGDDNHPVATVWDRKMRSKFLSTAKSRISAISGNTAVGGKFIEEIGGYCPVVWQVNGPVREKTFPEFTGVFSDINRKGEIVGHYDDPYRGGIAIRLGTRGEIVELSGTEVHSDAYAINDSGQIVGGIGLKDKYEFRAAIFKEGSYEILQGGTESSYALDNNNLGQIVGWADDGEQYAALWQDKELINLEECLDEPGWILYQANSIDEDGNILAVGVGPSGWSYVLLRPN